MPETFPESTPPAKSGAGFPAPATTGGQPPVVALVALGLAVLATALAIVGWFKPSTGPGHFSGEQRDEATATVCDAQGRVRQATGINTNMTNPDPANAAADLAIAANARLALFGGGAYLHHVLVANPATPEDLADAAKEMSDTMQTLGINYLAGAAPSGPVQQPLRDALKTQIAELDGLCQE